MAGPSPACTVKDGAGAPQTVVPFDVTAGNTVTIALASAAGVTNWSCTLYGQDESVTPPALTINSLAKTATFTAPSAPWTLIYKSVVNNGLDVNGVSQSSYTTTVGIHCKTASGKRLLASNETTEANTTTGWIAKANDAIRNASASAATSGRSVKSSPYNAVGDGVTDDTAAINACVAAGSGIVFFPQGIYKISAPITPILSNTALVGDNAVILQTGLVLATGRVTGQYSMFEIHPATAGFYVPVNISFEGIEFKGENSPFFQTILADQGPHAAVRVYNGASWPTDIYVTNCKFTNLYCNTVRTDTIGQRFFFTNNVSRYCGGELNPQFDESVISNNLMDTCWAIEATGQSVSIVGNVLSNCNSGISLGGNGGSQTYQRTDCGGTITGATNATPIVITCVNHRLKAGQAVTISGVGGNTAANIDGFAGTIVDADHFTLLAFGGSNTVGNGAYTSGGYVGFKGDFGCVIANNVIDTTIAGGGIQSGAPQVGLIIANNTIRKIATSQVGIHALATVSYFAAQGRLFNITGNSISAATHGILVECGDGHTIENNDVRIHAMPNPSPTSSTTNGIYVNGGGEVHHTTIRNNRSRGTSSDFLVISVANCVFTGNDGQLFLQDNGNGAVTFDAYEEPAAGITVTSGTPVFPANVVQRYTGSLWCFGVGSQSELSAEANRGGRAHTTNATPVTLTTFTMTSNEDAKYIIYVRATRDDLGAAALFWKTDDFKRVGSAAPVRSLSTSSNVDLGSDVNGTSWLCAITTSGNDVIVQATGQASTNITWSWRATKLVNRI